MVQITIPIKIFCALFVTQGCVYEKLEQQASDVKQFSHSLDKEQQQELEQQEESQEERQVK